MQHSGHYSAGDATCDFLTGFDEPKVLTIDDDPNVLQVLKLRFSQYKVCLLQAYHGAHGIWLATTEKPDVIITDLRMPQGRGQDVVEYLKNNSDTCHIPIVVVTGVRDDALRHRLRRLGVKAHLMKPVSFEDVREAVECFIELQEREK